MNARFCLVCLSFFSLLITSTLQASNVEKRKFAVEQVDGVPMITINGVPTRSRVFFGLMGSSPLFAINKWQTYENEFTALDDAYGDGTIHFRFGNKPGVVAIDNFSIVEKDTGRMVAGPYDFEKKTDYESNFKTYHETFQNKEIANVKLQRKIGHDGSTALVIRLNEYPNEWIPDFHLYHIRRLNLTSGKRYIVKFEMRADSPRAVIVNLYKPASPTFIKIGTIGHDVFKSQIQLAAKAGVNFVSFNPMTPVWPKEDGSYDWTKLDAVCDAVLEANPNALLIPRLRLNASQSWLDAHPDSKAKWENAGADCDGQGWDWAAPVSPEYRKTACDAMAAAIQHLETKYGDSIAGYHAAGQNTSEWFVPNTWTEGYPGFSNADRVAFQIWLKEKYQTNEALQHAWNDSDVTLDSAFVPSVKERDESRKKPIIESQKLLDFNRYWQSTMTGALCEIAKTIKKETNGRKLCLLFYGYSYEFSSVRKGPAASAHYALKELLDCPDVDIICSPLSYSERQLGGGGSCMLNAESVTAAGKIYFYEDDSRTYLTYAVCDQPQVAGTTNLADSVNVLLRNSGETSLRNFGNWLMDLGAAGWYDSPELWEAVASLEDLDLYFMNNPTPYKPEVGLFLSEESMLKISSGQYSAGISSFRKSVNLLGTPYAQYELNDLLDGKVNAPKLTIILNNDALDDQTRVAINNAAQKTNANVLYLDCKGVDTHRLRKEATKAGVWIYTDLWCNVWANGPFVLLHAPCDGKYTFTAPKGKNMIYDYFSNELLSNEGTCKIEMKLGNTKILRLE